MASIPAIRVRDVAFVIVAGLALSFAANALSPRGLSLHRDYFPAVPAPPAPAVVAPARASAPPATPTTAARTRRGRLLLTHEQVTALYQDPGRGEGRILFIDARPEAQFAKAHIPGAHPFDHYRPDQAIGNVLPLAFVAESIVVYCHGGDCEDSDLVAQDLIGLGVPENKLSVYAGGFAEWQQRGLPVEPAPVGGRVP